MSEAPKRIWANELSLRFTAKRDSGIFQAVQHEYIRANLVQSLLPYTKHHMTCAWHVGHIEAECTCGLTKVREELK